MLNLIQKLYADGVKTLIFTETKRGADDLTQWLHSQGFSHALCIHGDKSQTVQVLTNRN